jgi:4,5-dihydroxyphthalate decarboxylase
VPKLQLSLAICPYDHVSALRDGRVQVEGVELNVQHFTYPSEIFHRTLEYGEWDISELSFAKYTSLVDHGDDRFVAIPVFPSRCFRHSCVVVRADSPLSNLADLDGRSIGVPEWAQTAGIFVRGLLSHEHGLNLAAIDWCQGGVNTPGRREHAAIAWPPGVHIRSIYDRPLAHLLAEGEIDAIIAAAGPDSRLSPLRFRPLLADAAAAERDYFRRTRIFPIMHVVVIRRGLFERHPWLPANLRQAFDAAKRLSIQRMTARNLSLYPVPQLADFLTTWAGEIGADPWPYGIGPNQPTIEAFLRYAYEQGITRRPLDLEHLFVAASCDEFRN